MQGGECKAERKKVKNKVEPQNLRLNKTLRTKKEKGKKKS